VFPDAGAAVGAAARSWREPEAVASPEGDRLYLVGGANDVVVPLEQGAGRLALPGAGFCQ